MTAVDTIAHAHMHDAARAYYADCQRGNAAHSLYDAWRIEIDRTTPADARAIADKDRAARKAIEKRMAIERRVVRKTAQALIAAGYALRLHNGEHWATERTQKVTAIMSELQAADEERLHCYLPSTDSPTGWARVASIYLVYGNDGWDVLADYSMSLEDVLAPVMNYAESLSA